MPVSFQQLPPSPAHRMHNRNNSGEPGRGLLRLGAVLWLPKLPVPVPEGTQGLPTLWMENQGVGLAGSGVAVLPAQGWLHCVSREPRREEGAKGLEDEGVLIHLQVKVGGNGASGDQEHTRGVMWLPQPLPGDRMGLSGLVLLAPRPACLCWGHGEERETGCRVGLTRRCRSAHRERSRPSRLPGRPCAQVRAQARGRGSLHLQAQAHLCPGGGREGPVLASQTQQRPRARLTIQGGPGLAHLLPLTPPGSLQGSRSWCVRKGGWQRPSQKHCSRQHPLCLLGRGSGHGPLLPGPLSQESSGTNPFC